VVEAKFFALFVFSALNVVHFPYAFRAGAYSACLAPYADGPATNSAHPAGNCFQPVVGCADFKKQLFCIDAKLMQNRICFASVLHLFCETLKYFFLHISHRFFASTVYLRIVLHQIFFFRILFRIKCFVLHHNFFPFAS